MWWLALGLAVALTASCHNYFEFSGEAGPATLEGLDDPECPVGWTGTTLPADLQDDLDQGLTQIFVAIGAHAQSELDRRNAPGMDALKLLSLTLHMTDSTDATDMQSSFGFLMGLEVFVESAQGGSDLPRRRIAHVASIPETATSLPLIVDSDVNLKAYVAEGIRISTEPAARSCLRHAVPFSGSYVAEVLPRN